MYLFCGKAFVEIEADFQFQFQVLYVYIKVPLVPHSGGEVAPMSSLSGVELFGVPGAGINGVIG